MISNYFKTAFRNIVRNKFYTILNVLGLSIGFIVFIFIFMFVKDELTYDRNNVKHERIYRIGSDFTISNKHERFAIVPIPMAPALKIEYPEIEEFCRLTNIGNTLIQYKDIEFYEEHIFFADSTIFYVFTHELILGDPKTALTEPNTAVINETFAARYFGNENPIGEIFTTGGGLSFMVKGVMKNQVDNTHLKYDVLLSAATLADLQGADNFNSLEPNRFWNIGVYSYILLHEGSSINSIHEKFPQFYDKYMRSLGDQINASFELLSMPLADVHLNSKLASDETTGDISYVYILISVAVFILLIASINYMNMATARSTKRAREVGLRKVMGALRPQLIRQFLTESVLLSLISLLIAFGVIFILINDFNTLSGKMLDFNAAAALNLFLTTLIIAIFIGLVSGSYPAFYLSKFLPIKVLKGTVTSGGKKSGLFRRVLVVFQFLIAIIMIIGTMLVSDQLHFLKNKDLGFNKENIVILQMQDTSFIKKHDVFKKELLNNPNILSVYNGSGYPGNINWIQVMRVEKEDEMADVGVMLNMGDFDFVKTFGLEIIQGRDLDINMTTDNEQAVLINEEGVKQFGWEDNPLGKKIEYGISLDGTTGRIMKIVGVYKDFHFKSLHNKVEPLIIFISPRPMYNLCVKISENNTRETLDFIEEKWNSFGANRPFDHKFLDQELDEMYSGEAKIGVIFRIATILTIFTALLGLLGLSSFVTEQRTKEIGIRKVVGATLTNILTILTKEFIILIGIAFVIAIPIAWWQFDIWLESNFIYRIDISWMVFLVSGLLAFIVGLLTVGYHIIKAASGNPVDSIKYE